MKIMRRFSWWLLAFVAAAGLSMIGGANAQTFGGQIQNNGSVTLCDPLGSGCNYGGETFASIATKITNFLAWIAVPITILMVLVGAFQLMTSSGDPEKLSRGKKTLTWAAVGFVIALCAAGITGLILNILTNPS